MNLFELFVKIGVDDQASNKIGNLSSKLGNGLKTAAKIGTAAVTAAATGITALTTAAVKNYAEYEQLVGGVDTLFKKSSQKVQEYAANAYKTAGLSANEYMSTVTSFSASLLQSLGGDTEKAAEYADQAIIDMSDNANKMGTDMSLIQNAYQGFAKGNYTMLDNLKLGYGGTATEMARLINDSGVLKGKLIDLTDAKNIGFELQQVGFAKITEAIHLMQEQMGIAGTTQKEASETISGSLNSMKGAWSNLVTGIADDNADFDTLINNMVESAGTFAENLLPRIEVALGGMANLIEKLAPIIVEKIPSLVSTILPTLISAATGMVNSVIAVLPSLLETVVTALVENAPLLIEATIGLVNSLIQSIQDNAQILIDGAINIVMTLTDGILSMLPEIIKLGLDLIVSLATGITNSLDTLIPTIIGVVLQIVDTLTNPETLMNIIEAGIELLLGLIDGIVGAIPELIRAVPKIIASIVTVLIAELPTIISAAIEIVFALIDGLIGAIPELVAAIPNLIIGIVNGLLNNLDKIILAAPQIILSLIKGLIGAIPELVMALPRVIMSIVNTFKSYNWGSIGKNIVQGLKDGISKMWNNLKKWFKNLFGDLIGIAKKILGIASPSKVFKKLGGWTAEGFGIGFEDAFGDVEDDIENALDFGESDYGITTSSTSISDFGGGSSTYGYGGSQNVNVTVGIDNSANAMGLARALLPFLKIAEKEVYA